MVPKVIHRNTTGPPKGTLHCAEDGAQTRNIQQLDQEQLPLGHDNVVNAIVDANSRSFPVIRPEGVVNDFTISQVADDQQSRQSRKLTIKDSSYYDFLG